MSQAHAVVLTFQDGMDGYAGTADTQIYQYLPNTEFGSQVYATVGYGEYQALLKFQDVIGDGLLQVPVGSTINSASITFTIGDDSAQTYDVHEVYSSWNESSTWSTLGSGISLDDVEAVSTPIGSFVPAMPVAYSLDITSAAQRWADGGVNNGFLVRAQNFSWIEGTAFLTREFVDLDPSMRPLLTVDFTAPPVPTPEPGAVAPILALMAAWSFVRRKRARVLESAE